MAETGEMRGNSLECDFEWDNATRNAARTRKSSKHTHRCSTKEKREFPVLVSFFAASFMHKPFRHSAAQLHASKLCVRRDVLLALELRPHIHIKTTLTLSRTSKLQRVSFSHQRSILSASERIRIARRTWLLLLTAESRWLRDRCLATLVISSRKNSLR